MNQKLTLFFRLLNIVRNWPTYVLNRLGWINGDRVTWQLRNGFTITSRPFRIDRSALNDVWLEESYEPSKFGIAWNWKDCRCIVDIGANIGTFTVYAASKAPSARIVALEPEPGNVAMARRNVEDNNLSGRVTVIPVGIAASDGTATLNVTNKVSGGHSMYHSLGNTRPLTVDTLSLATLFDRQKIGVCDFLKLDCEGAEYDALYALPREVLEKIRFMAIECHLFSSDPKHTPDALKAFLKEQGFAITAGKKSMFFAQKISKNP